MVVPESSVPVKLNVVSNALSGVALQFVAEDQVVPGSVSLAVPLYVKVAASADPHPATSAPQTATTEVKRASEMLKGRERRPSKQAAF
jgi:hypothetical protein